MLRTSWTQCSFEPDRLCAVASLSTSAPNNFFYSLLWEEPWGREKRSVPTPCGKAQLIPNGCELADADTMSLVTLQQQANTYTETPGKCSALWGQHTSLLALRGMLL